MSGASGSADTISRADTVSAPRLTARTPADPQPHRAKPPVALDTATLTLTRLTVPKDPTGRPDSDRLAEISTLLKILRDLDALARDYSVDPSDAIRRHALQRLDALSEEVGR